MLLFDCIFDVRNCLVPFVRGYAKSGQEAELFRIKVLGQEKNDDILFCFDCLASTKSTEVTHIGVYSQVTAKCKVVFALEGLADVVSCTINQLHSLLLFTVYERRHTGTGGGSKHAGMYSLFLAELASNRRKMPLSLQRPYHIAAHFLYGTTDKAHHVLVFVHTESVRHYRITIDGIEAVPQWKHDNIFKSHVWYQWECHSQRLFIAHTVVLLSQRKEGNKSGSQPVTPTEAPTEIQAGSLFSSSLASSTTASLICLTFSEKGISRRLFEASLALPAASLSTKYDHRLLTGTVPDCSLNACVLTHPCGTVVFCRQRQPSALSIKHAEPSNTQTLEYSVYSLIHGQTLRVAIPNVTTTRRKPWILFSTYRDYILVYLPGSFVHLIDVDPHMDLNFHVIYSSPLTHSGVSTNKRLSRIFLGSRTPVAGLYDASEGRAYSVQLSPERLLDFFSSSNSPVVRVGIMWLALQYCQEAALPAKLLEAMKSDVASPEVQPLLAEYIMGCVYATQHKHLAFGASCLLPFSLEDDAYRAASIKEKPGDQPSVEMSFTNCNKLLWHADPVASKEDVWLCNFIGKLKVRLASKRLSLKAVFGSRRLTSLSVESNGGKSNLLSAAFDKVFKRRIREKKAASERLHRSGIASAISSRLNTQLEGNASSAATNCFAPSLLTGSEGSLYDSPVVIAVLHQLLDSLKSVSSESVDTGSLSEAATDYISAVCTELQQLPISLWSLYGLRVGENLEITGARSNIAGAFQMFERYYTVVTELGLPVSHGFSTVFTMLGYQTLIPRVFLQYVDAGILALAGHSVQLPFLQKEHNSTADGRLLLAHCINRLPKEDARMCCRIATMPSAVKYAAEEIVSSCFIADGSRLEKSSSTSSLKNYLGQGNAIAVADEDRFGAHRAFETLVHQLKVFNVDSEFLEKAAFTHTAADPVKRAS